ncbi:hypothetical protein Salmi_Mp113 (mitochondrion) [Salvia miltiorrhiza]|uniref:Uncharacterized protein n=1 Tax=Salvia miltiorrhiza TaxID=226208 RepID=V9P514_SALMI|nr:hypothetical protein Salmi_Mp113 [Salvia miltiorrhiza]AGU16641.1 hypothetical protein Salmi_Mp113 [Salvia miltiorrhiza]
MAVPSSNTAYSSAPSMEYCSKCHFLSLLWPLVNYATKMNSTVSRFTAERTSKTRGNNELQANARGRKRGYTERKARYNKERQVIRVKVLMRAMYQPEAPISFPLRASPPRKTNGKH